MKLDPKLLKYMTKEQWRVLSAVEQGMKNHSLVPLELVVSIAGLRHGGAQKVIGALLRNKLIARNSQKYEGYRLTYLGYDFLALRVFVARGTVTGVGRMIGVGKESDIYLVRNDEGTTYALKLHRLGRVSFKTIKTKRDYLQGRHKSNWLYISRLAAVKEFAFMKALYQNDFSVPTPVDQNRHCVVMGLCQGFPLYQIKTMDNAELVYKRLMDTIVRLAQYGLIHCDFNEFNLMISKEGDVTVIDFPQMISTEHENAKFYFDRDVECVRKFFGKILKCDVSKYPRWGTFGPRLRTLDSEVKASGFSVEAETQFNKLMKEQKELEVKLELEGDTDEVELKDDMNEVELKGDMDEVDLKGDDEVEEDKDTEEDEVDTDEIPSIPISDVKPSELAVPSAKRNEDIVARVRAQRNKRNAKDRRRRTATRNKNKQRGKREIKKSAKASLRAAMSPW
jgi:RIO kinase 2